ncbi:MULTISPECIES: recombinase family protein [Lysobacter]|uniref:recombinase family protein n=1 Tax=Lysobacter TaxID=68 RepID=UPI001F1F21F2|nr:MULTISPECIES: recombinase family protein [Lysobacter]UJB19239.1 recombinase family protein [Lysobacter capsici]UJQ27036.1 recombinase family protein [Lysobacter gummosus]
MNPPRRLRCAVYTRKSTEEGLEREYNTIDAQRDAGHAFIASRKGEGWIPVGDDYDDPGYSAATLNRPALQRLLDDVRAGRIDIIVTYKIDRLSRSLRDFHELWDVLAAHNVEFVSVTQQFNTTDSMGRLMLNILLSFAEFDRELDADRARDKMIASKKKGLWMHGVPPLGYDLKDRRLAVNDTEAAIVRRIFERVAAGTSTAQLVQELKALGATSKCWTTQKDRQIVGKPIDKSLIYKMLANRTYLGELRHGELWFPNAHMPIIDTALWERAQAAIASPERTRTLPGRSQVPFPLRGLVFASDGRAMTPWHTTKRGRTYRYYVHTRALHEGAGAVKLPRVSAGEFEAAVIEQLRHVLRAPEVVAAVIPQALDLDPTLDEAQVTIAMLRLDEIWQYLLADEQARMLQLLIERVVVNDRRAELRLRPLGLASLTTELLASEKGVAA